MNIKGSLDPAKVITLIELIKEGLSKNETYRVNCQLSSAEIVELKKQFEVENDFDDIYIFKKKNND